jgi:acyl-CoA thioester hydrolase
VGRAEAIRELGFSYREMEDLGVIMPIVEWQGTFLRPALYDDLLTIKTTLRELPVDHRIEFHQEVFNASGKLLTQGRVVLFFLRKGDRKKTTMPVALREKLQAYFAADPLQGDQDYTR